MGSHSVPRGEKSSLGAANASPGTPGYQGKHRSQDGIKGYKVGSDKRRKNSGQDYERDR